MFKDELREALQRPDPADPIDERSEFRRVWRRLAATEAFLLRLWHELYGDEPLDAPM